MLAMNDYAVFLKHRGVCIASKPAPTVIAFTSVVIQGSRRRCLLRWVVQIITNCLAPLAPLLYNCAPCRDGWRIRAYSRQDTQVSFTPCLTVFERQATTRKEHSCVITKSSFWSTRIKANKSAAW
ncbi:hypothetical protein GC387_09585 [Pseudomonas sp. MWU12-2323]|nr:hypothetical protein [Pseudomonas sp. MWU12-2323]RBH57905.1 hypothetical protein C3F00_009195 [Pseudomonas sp. MWU13-2860]